MEKRINYQLEKFLIKFKDDIKNKMTTLHFGDSEKSNELLEFVYDYDRLYFSKDDEPKISFPKIIDVWQKNLVMNNVLVEEK